MLYNFTPHTIVLRDADGRDHAYEPDPRGPARIVTDGGLARHHPSSPVPVYDPGGRGAGRRLVGLPERSDPEDLFVVSAIVLGFVREKLAYDIGRDYAGPMFSVLDRCVAPGTGPDDGAVRWTTDDAPLPGLVGQIRAVTRLVR